MDGLSESEELELLQLQKQKAMAEGHLDGSTTTIPQDFEGALQQVTSPLELLKQKFSSKWLPPIPTAESMHPKNLTSMLPTAGMMAGGALGSALPVVGTGVGMSAGAGLGSIAQKMANLAYGTTPPVNPTTTIAGIPMNPKAAIDPMVNAAAAGVPETPEGQAIGQKVSDIYQSMKPGFKKAVGAVGQVLTGKPAAKVRQIIEDPEAILPESAGGAKSVAKASDQYGKALDNSGMEKKLYGPFSEGKAAADKDASAIYAMWKNGDPITAQEAYNAKRATDKLWPTVVKERNAEDIREMSDFKSGMDDILSNLKGRFLKASKDYARARLGSDFTQVLPRTKTGDISTVKTFILPMLDPKRIVPLLATSPAAFGAANLGTQAAMKGLNVIGSDPNARQALLGLLQQLLSKQSQGQ